MTVSEDFATTEAIEVCAALVVYAVPEGTIAIAESAAMDSEDSAIVEKGRYSRSNVGQMEDASREDHTAMRSRAVEPW